MAIPSKQIGWSQESNLLWEITKQMDRLTKVVSTSSTASYKVYTALLTQSGGSNILQIGSGLLTIGVTYQILEDAGPSGWDFTNVGAPNNNVGTYFVATGTTPNSWTNAELQYNTGAPTVTVLENTIGNITWTYQGVGLYYGTLNNSFPQEKTFCTGLTKTAEDGTSLTVFSVVWGNSDSVAVYSTMPISESGFDDLFNYTPIEIRVYN